MPIPESAVPNDGIKLGIKYIMFNLPTLPVLRVSFRCNIFYVFCVFCFFFNKPRQPQSS